NRAPNFPKEAVSRTRIFAQQSQEAMRPVPDAAPSANPSRPLPMEGWAVRRSFRMKLPLYLSEKRRDKGRAPSGVRSEGKDGPTPNERTRKRRNHHFGPRN